MPEQHARRRARLAERITEGGFDAALVTRLVNVRYLTGFSGSNGALLLTPGAAVLATDGRYEEQAAAEAPDVERLIERAVAHALAARAAERGLARVAYETHDVTVDLHHELGEAAPALELVSLGQAVESLRAVKDDAEIALVAEACAIADRALAELLAGLRPGRTERDVAAELEGRMRAHGADGPSFETIVASGPNSAVPHHHPSDRELRAGELLKLDFGALHAGYHSDMTRTVVLGPVADWQRDLHALVDAAARAGREAVADGTPAVAVDRAARSVIERAGQGERFMHGLGHGVGLDVQERPWLGQSSDDTLRDGMVLTVEPGVYLPGRGGVRIEDIVVVGQSGGDGAAPRILTGSPRELLVL
ncbi:MAG: M24 family metallopeptidase [Frankiaceae bacterium]